MKPVVGVFLLLISLSSCEEQFGTNNREVPQEIIDISRGLFFGEILEKVTAREDEADVWKVKIRNDNGSVVSFFWLKSYHIIFKIQGEQGPFDYDLQPPLSALPLSTAKFLAFESYSSEALSSWTLKRSKSDDRSWIYCFYILGHEQPLVINALSGDSYYNY